MQSVIIGQGSIGYVSTSNIHDLEFCQAKSGGGPDGPWFSDMNNSLFDNLYCSNAYYTQFDFFRQDYLAHVSNLNGFGGRAGVVKGVQFTSSLIVNTQTDGAQVGEVAEGGGGGNYEEDHSHVIDRGGLIYAWIENQDGGIINWPFVDQEGTSLGFLGTFLFNDPVANTNITNGNIDTRNGSPYLIQDGGGIGPTINGMLFNTFGGSVPANFIVDYTGGSPNPSSPIRLTKCTFPNGTSGFTNKVPLTNLGPESVVVDDISTLQLLNDTGTGTTLHKLVRMTGAPAAAVIVGTSDTTAVGICIATCGQSGTAEIQALGAALCVFDATTVTAGDWVTTSSTTAGDCHDTGVSSYTAAPPSGTRVGIALTSGSASTSQSINLAFSQPSGILANYGHITNITNAASPYTVLGTDYFISCNATAGATTITLPAATGTGRQLIIKKSDSSGNACTISRSGSDLIDGATTAVDGSQYQSFSIMDAGSAVWSIF